MYMSTSHAFVCQRNPIEVASARLAFRTAQWVSARASVADTRFCFSFFFGQIERGISAMKAASRLSASASAMAAARACGAGSSGRGEDEGEKPCLVAHLS